MKIKYQGIYAIFDSDGSCWYVGQSMNIYERWRAHKGRTYKYGDWHNEMQSRLGDFKFEILEIVDDVNKLRVREDYYIKKLKPKYTTTKSNKGSQVGQLSEETKDKISENRKGKCTGEDSPAKRQDVRDKISAKNSGENHGMFGKGYLISGENNGCYGVTFTWMNDGKRNHRVQKGQEKQKEKEGLVYGYIRRA